MSSFAFHPEAVRDLDEIWDFIAEETVDGADRVVGEILDTCERLALFPYQGYERRELSSKPLRFLPVREFLLVYAPDENPLMVIAVLHGRRNPRVLAALLRGR